MPLPKKGQPAWADPLNAFLSTAAAEAAAAATQQAVLAQVAAEAARDQSEAYLEQQQDLAGIDTPDALVSYLLRDRASATGETLVTEVAAVAEPRAGIVVAHDWSTSPPGQPAKFDTGQVIKFYGSLQAAQREPFVDGAGWLTADPEADKGSYTQAGPLEAVAPLGSPRLNYASVTFKSPFEVVGGAVGCVAFMEKSFPEYAAATGAVPRSPLHLLFNRTQVWWTKFPVEGGQPLNASPIWTRGTGLLYDDVTVHGMRIWLDTDNGIGYIEDPSGRIYAHKDAAIRDIPAHYLYQEGFWPERLTINVGTTSGSATVTDVTATAGYKGRPITGPGIPPNTYVGTITAGASFLLSSDPINQVSVNATATGTVQAVLGVATMARYKWGTIHTGTKSRDEIASVAARYWRQPLVETRIAATTDLTAGLSGTHSKPAGDPTAFTFRVPPSKRVRIIAEFMVDVTTAISTSEVRFGLQNATNALLTYEIVRTGTGLGSARCRMILDHSLTEDPWTEVTRKISFAKSDGSTPAGNSTFGSLILKPQVGGYIKVEAII